jgi:hypothetical protein
VIGAHGLRRGNLLVGCEAGALANGVPQNARPQFLKIPYSGPEALSEVVTYDPSLIVGILGGVRGLCATHSNWRSAA